jgi:hypothetical protein
MNAGADRPAANPSCRTGSIAAGLVVALIGLVIAAFEGFGIGGLWSTMAIGLALIGLGVRGWATPRAAGRGRATPR